MSPIYKVSAGNVRYRLALPDAETDYIQRTLATSGQPYEPEMLEAMALRLSPGDLVLDIGANVGNHSIYLAAVAGATVHAFEPSSHLTDAIRKSVIANNFGDRLVVHTVAVGEKSGSAVLAAGDGSNLGGQHLVTDDSSENVVESDVEVIALDSLPFESRVKALKVDVEGYEVPVLKGALTLLENDHPDVWIECLDFDHFSEVESILHQIGYTYAGVYNASPTHHFTWSATAPSEETRAALHQVISRSYKTYSDYQVTRKSLQAANNKYREATTQYAEFRDKNNELARAQAQELSSLTSERAAALDRVRALERELSDTTHQLTAITAENQLQVPRLSDSVRDLRTRSAESDKQHTAELTALQEKHASEISESHATFQEVKERLDAANLKYRQLTEGAGKLKELLETARARESAIAAELADTKSDLEQKVEAAERTRREEVLALTAEIDVLKQKITQTHERHSAATAAIHANYADRKAHLDAQAAELQRKEEFYKKDFRTLRAYVAESSEERERLMSQVESLNTAIARAKVDLKKADRHNSLELGQAHRRIAKEIADKRSLADQLEEAELKRRSLKHKIIVLQAETEASQRRISAMNSELETLSLRSAHLEATSKSQVKSLQDAAIEVQSQKARINAVMNSKTYRAGAAVRDMRTFKGFWLVIPRLLSILSEPDTQEGN